MTKERGLGGGLSIRGGRHHYESQQRRHAEHSDAAVSLGRERHAEHSLHSPEMRRVATTPLQWQREARQVQVVGGVKVQRSEQELPQTEGRLVRVG